jgi:flagellar hook-associated protein 3 FlgL
MRISNKAIYDSVGINLGKTASAMFKANEVVSSGKRINRSSDDPIGLVNVLNVRSALDNVQQLERNISTGRSWLQMGESAMTQVNDILTQLKALSVEMASGTKDASARASAAGQVDGLLRQVVALANTQVSGKYIFGGTNTDTAPFRLDDEANPTMVIYDGNDTPFSVRIGKDILVDVGLDGESVFGDAPSDWTDPTAGANNFFKTLIDLRDALSNNDTQGIEQAMTRLDSHMQVTQQTISDIGTKDVRMDVKESIIADLKLTYTDRMSTLEDADIAEAMTDLQARQLAYQAALASSSQVMQLSLVDYLTQ